MKCSCTFPQGMVGGGYPIDNPEYWENIDKMWIEECRQEYRDDIALEMRHNIMIDVDAFQGDWDMLAEYFTIE